MRAKREPNYFGTTLSPLTLPGGGTTGIAPVEGGGTTIPAPNPAGGTTIPLSGRAVPPLTCGSSARGRVIASPLGGTVAESRGFTTSGTPWTAPGVCAPGALVWAKAGSVKATPTNAQAHQGTTTLWAATARTRRRTMATSNDLPPQRIRPGCSHAHTKT